MSRSSPPENRVLPSGLNARPQILPCFDSIKVSIRAFRTSQTNRVPLESPETRGLAVGRERSDNTALR